MLPPETRRQTRRASLTAETMSCEAGFTQRASSCVRSCTRYGHCVLASYLHNVHVLWVHWSLSHWIRMGQRSAPSPTLPSNTHGFHTGRVASNYLTWVSIFLCVGIKFNMTPDAEHKKNGPVRSWPRVKIMTPRRLCENPDTTHLVRRIAKEGPRGACVPCAKWRVRMTGPRS